MTKVVILGAAGRLGREIAQFLRDQEDVTAIGLVGRDAAKLSQLGEEIGSKAQTAVMDVTDTEALTGLLRNYDYVCNVTGHYPKLIGGVLAAAIASSTHYLDVSEGWPEAELILQCAEAVEQNNLVFISGIGSTPGVTNLLAKHLAQGFEEIESLHCGFFTVGATYLPKHEELRELKRGNTLTARDEIILELASGSVKIALEGRLQQRKAMQDRATFKFIGGEPVTVYPVNMSHPISLSRHFAVTKNLSACMAFLPDQINLSMAQYGQAYAERQLNDRQALYAFYDDVVELVEASESLADGLPKYAQWAYIKGRCNGKLTEKVCTPSKPLSISATLTAALLQIIRKPPAGRGVFFPEDLFNGNEFLAQVYQLQYGDANFSIREQSY